VNSVISSYLLEKKGLNLKNSVNSVSIKEGFEFEKFLLDVS